ncbi:hypothetical protein MPTK1_1g13720 [Marchantia polymorpha subsp. ruderalis]|uniref:Uncharacterized protein n=2 Tax=Marchantia polymorpha TaxID=3197 RepID=A0AAF6APT9_MARPO|nr:hypothetical protein MARPO_0019s0142 [Marchantia polymorpha]BBM98459.1 hypothetical protein Mp_1g13720 [Marchantia polymorpha subsp. ruderalis]|eukprot:PTQ44730.1 hypothetical protein MARPO_0019s0142 [Marchantia polymorpha]
MRYGHLSRGSARVVIDIVSLGQSQPGDIRRGPSQSSQTIKSRSQALAPICVDADTCDRMRQARRQTHLMPSVAHRQEDEVSLHDRPALLSTTTLPFTPHPEQLTTRPVPTLARCHSTPLSLRSVPV